MLVIRLSRVGKKKRPSYRIVVQDRQRDPWGTSVDIVGNYNPLTSPSTVVFKEDRIKHWLEKGAQPSATVHNLLVTAGLMKGSKVKATTHDRQDRPGAKEEPKKTEAPATEAAAKPETKTEETPTVTEKPPAETPAAEEPKAEEPAQ